MKPLTRLTSAAAIAAVLATAACNRSPDAPQGNAQAQFALPALPATLPLQAGAATPIASAPSASDLPEAAPLKLARVADQSQAYGYADAAYSYDEALGDAPPDYGFNYGSTDPWAWQGYDDSTMFAEPIDDGYRYYYYRPGAAEPYFVRDPYYSYGFAGGLLAVIYAADGGIVPYADYGPRLGYASRYFARGRSLWSASRQAQRRPVIAANWVRQRPVIVAARDRWGAGRAHQPGWQRFYDANRPRQAAYWQTEQLRRQADARRFADWRQQGFRSAPPPRAIPAAWQGARWARDDRRYRPAAAALRDRQQARPDRLGAGGPGTQLAAGQARRDQVQADRQAQRAQAQAARRPAAPLDRRGADQAQTRAAQQAQRQQAQRPQVQHADRAQRQQAQAAQRQQAQTAQRQQAQTAQRQQAQTAQRQQAQTAQRQQAQTAQRQQAQTAQRQQAQAQAAQRQQAQAAQRQQAQQARQAQQAARQQMQPARPAERQAAPLQLRAGGDGGGRHGGGPGPN